MRTSTLFLDLNSTAASFNTRSSPEPAWPSNEMDDAVPLWAGCAVLAAGCAVLPAGCVDFAAGWAGGARFDAQAASKPLSAVAPDSRKNRLRDKPVGEIVSMYAPPYNSTVSTNVGVRITR